MRSALERFSGKRPARVVRGLGVRALGADTALGRRLAYLIPTLAAFGAVQTWLEPGKLLGSGDLTPLLKIGTEYRSHWNQFATGTGSATYDVVQLPLAELQRFASWLGMSDSVFQQFWVTALFAGVAAATVYLCFGFVDSPLAAGTAGILATFNAYRLTTSFDTISLVATIAAAVLGGMVVRAARGRAPNPIAFALCSPLLALSFVNPPHLALIAIWVVACGVIAGLVWGRSALAALARFLARALPLTLLVSLWWFVPVVLTLTAPTFRELYAAPGITAWQFTHVRSSLGNVLDLRSQWGWGHLEYYPYAKRLDGPVFVVLGYFLPALAVAGVVLSWKRQRRLAVALAAFALLTVLVAKGIHSPLSGTNWWLYDHVPGFFLFREPAKVLLLLVFAFAILGGLAVSRLPRVLPPLAAGIVATVFVGGAVAYAHPLLTGEVVPDNRPILPPTHVRIPAGWYQAAEYLNSRPEDGKVLVMPPPDFYALPTSWGYYGASFARLLIHRGVIEPVRQTYFRTPESVFDTVDFIVRNLIDPKGSDVRPQLQALGARYVLVRRDLQQGFEDRYFPDPDVLGRGLARFPDVHRVASFGTVLDLYRLDDHRPTEVFAAQPVRYQGSSAGIPVVLGRASDVALVDAKTNANTRRLRLPAPGESTLDPRRANALQDCDQYNKRSYADLGLAQRVFEQGGATVLQLEALHHSACVTLQRDLSNGVTAFRLALDYRTVEGSPARICLWFVGPNRCANIPPLPASADWRHFTTEVRRAPNTTQLVLYLYADGADTGPTVTEFKRLDIAELLPAVRVGARPAGSPPTVSYRRIGPSEFRVHVEGAKGPHLLVAAESWSPGWRISIKGHDTDDVSHVQVNGFENGWLVPLRGTYDARLFYGPERYAHAALWTIPLYLLLAATRIGQTFLPLLRRRLNGRRSS